jgi:SAM-dependent methyltransferase
MHQHFSLAEAARRYEAYRPKVHNIVLEWLSNCLANTRFNNAIDIACGTGDSTLPLLQIADNVIGIDSSEPMLYYAVQKGLKVIKLSYTDLPGQGKYDLLSTCMAFHWFDPVKAIEIYKHISVNKAVWIIYNFAFGGHESSLEFNQWFHGTYLKQYPSPPRGRMANVVPKDDSEICTLKEAKGYIPIAFSSESLINYLTTQSNVENAVKNGMDYQEITDDLLNQIKDISISGQFQYVYTYGLYQYMAS